MIVQNIKVVDLKQLIIEMTDLGENEYRAITSYIFTFTGSEVSYVDSWYIRDDVNTELIDMCQEVTYAIEKELGLLLDDEVILKLDLNYQFE